MQLRGHLDTFSGPEEVLGIYYALRARDAHDKLIEIIILFSYCTNKGELILVSKWFQKVSTQGHSRGTRLRPK